MHASEVTPEAIERVNQLYWDSGRSVNQIADELDLSKGALYGVIRPEPSGLGCPLCGAEVGYPNRTAKDRGSLECSICTWDGNVDEATGSFDGDATEGDAGSGIAYVPDGGPDPGHEGDGYDGLGGLPPTPPASALLAPDLRTLATGALIGAAVGLVFVLWTRRR
jgi:hypothetical protein